MKWINLLGLAFDILGAALMYFNTPKHSYAPPSRGNDISLAGHYHGFGKAKEKKENIHIRWGFLCLITGFILQLIAALFSK